MTTPPDRYIVLDFETTGLTPGYRPIEIAWLEFDKDFNVLNTAESLINPRIPIEPSATEVHGITDRLVAESPSLVGFIGDQFLGDRVLVVGHNVQFDAPFFAPFCREMGTLCTLKLSLVVNPEATSHSLGSLAELLGVVEEPTHRAAADVATCFSVLRYYSLSLGVGLGGLLERSRSLNADSIMSFGAHRGKPIRDLPSSYKGWVLAKFDPGHWLVEVLRGLEAEGSAVSAPHAQGIS